MPSTYDELKPYRGLAGGTLRVTGTIWHVKCKSRDQLTLTATSRLPHFTVVSESLATGTVVRVNAAVATAAGYFTMSTMIRPALNSLRGLPTLHQVSESWGRLELKLETEDTRYWITTEGVSQKTSGTPINYVVDYVTVEKLSDDGNWDLKAVYSPEAWKLSQAFDYCQILYQELNRLNATLEERFSWEVVRERDGVQSELEQANKVVFELSDKVRSRC